jgi:hypothetical protein
MRLYIKQVSVKIKADICYEIDKKTENFAGVFSGLLGCASHRYPYIDTENSISGARIGQVASFSGVYEPCLFAVVFLKTG